MGGLPTVLKARCHPSPYRTCTTAHRCTSDTPTPHRRCFDGVSLHAVQHPPRLGGRLFSFAYSQLIGEIIVGIVLGPPLAKWIPFPAAVTLIGTSRVLSLPRCTLYAIHVAG